MNPQILNRNSEPPSDGWYQIEVTGEHPASDGRTQVIDSAALFSIVNRFRSDKEAAGDKWCGILVDRDHLSHDPEQTTEAMAWLQDLEIRNGQLYGLLDLTDLGTAAVRNRRYKRFSTEYSAADLQPLGANRVRPLRLSGLAFTNRPNNRGGKPISNRSHSGPSENQTTPTPKTMQSIAEKLGLSAEASEADILAAIDALLQQTEEAATKQKETEADAVLNRFGSRVPEAAKQGWRTQLIANREATEALMEATLPAAATAPARIHNRTTAVSPAPITGASHAEAKGDEQAALVSQIRNRDHCTHAQAWDQARRERPDLF